MPFRVNGTDYDPQIKGSPAEEVQINGETVWTRSTVYEDHESGSSAMNNFTATTYDPSGWASITSTSAFQGSYAFHGNKTSDQGPRIAIHTGGGISRGNTYSYLFRIGAGQRYGGGFQFGIDSTNMNQSDVNGYQARVDMDLDGGRLLLHELSSGHTSQQNLSFTSEPNLTDNHTYRVEVRYDSTVQLHIYDWENGDTHMGSTSASHSGHNGSYWGWFAIQNGSTSDVWDYMHEP